MRATHNIHRFIHKLRVFLRPWQVSVIERDILISMFGCNDEALMIKERLLEGELRKLLLNCKDEEERVILYERNYDIIYNFFENHSKKTRNQQMQLPFNNPILKLIGSGKKVLEVGCGDGYLSCTLALLGNYCYRNRYIRSNAQKG